LNTDVRSLVPSLLLAAGVLVATLISLRSSSSLLWALAGPFALAATLVVVASIASQQASAPAWIMGGSLFLAGAIVALADAASVPLMMPILGACAAVVLMPRRRCDGVKRGA